MGLFSKLFKKNMRTDVTPDTSSFSNPEEAFLLSSAGLGSLDKVLNVLAREDLLDFGTGKRIKKIKTAKWDVARNTIDYHSIIPKI